MENIQLIPVHDPDSRYQGGTEVDDDKPEHPLDSPAAEATLLKLVDLWHQFRDAQAENRMEMAKDEDFYDGLQWSDEDMLELLERGQAPLVFNHIKPSVDWVIGTEKRTRIDFKVLPRGKEDNESAGNKTKLLKYLSDVNKSQYARSRAFADAVKVGLGWLEDGIRSDPGEEPLYSRNESWRNMWYDHLSVERDLSDARALFRAKWLDVDVACAMFPERADRIKVAAVSNTKLDLPISDEGWYANLYGMPNDPNEAIIRKAWFTDGMVGSPMSRRNRVLLVEAWYRVPVRRQVMRGYLTPLDGQVYDTQNEKHQQAHKDGIVSLYDAVVMEMRLAMFTGDGRTLLQDMKSPYRHNRFPFTPVWAYRRGRDNAPYGAIRQARDPQEDMNKRASKALFILSTNKIIGDKNAVDDWNEAIDEAARPDGVIRVNGDRRFELVNNTELAEEHLMLMDRDQRFIQNIGGVTDENLGRDTNAVSGKAIIAKQDQGSVVTFELFDNLRYAIQLQGEKELALIEQFYDAPKVIRLVGDKGRLEFIDINTPERDPETGGIRFLNDITASQADFIVDTADFNRTARLAMADELMALLQRLALPPDIAIRLLDIIVDMYDIPGRDELVARIRKITGEVDPADAGKPEAKMAEERKRQAEEEARALEHRERMAAIEEREAKTEKTRVETQRDAIDAGVAVATTPSVMPAADQVLAAAGFNDKGGT